MRSFLYLKLFFLLLFFIPVYLQAQTLKELLHTFASKNNLVRSATFSNSSKEQELESQKSTYYPTLDLGAYYQRLDDRTFLVPGDIYTAFAKLSFDIYDGGKRSATVSQKNKELESSVYDKEALKKSIALSIVEDFYTLKNAQATQKALLQAQKSLKAQLQRVTRFYEANVATKDDVDKLQSVYDSNEYTIDSLDFQIFSLKKTLELKVGVTIEKLEDAHFLKSESVTLETLDTTKALIAKKESLSNAAKSLQSVYYPHIRVEDTYSFSAYGRTDALHPEGLDKQNKILLTLNMRLYDNASVSKTKESVLLSSYALNEQIIYKTKEQKLQHELAVQRIKTSQSKIRSAKSALKSAKSAFENIEKKYSAGVVDNVAYLDALSILSNAQAQYKISLHDLELAYAMYYFYSGENIEEYLQ